MSRRRLTRAEKIANAEAFEAVKDRIKTLGVNYIEFTDVHHRIVLRNKRLVEIYPSKMSLHRVGKGYKRFNSAEALMSGLSRIADMPPAEQDDFEVIEE